MNAIPQQLLISGTALCTLALLIGFAIPIMPNARMGMAAHVTGLQSGVMLWVMGLLWHRLVLADGAQRAAQVLAVSGLYAIFASQVLAALWGASRSMPIAGVGHQASPIRETAVAVLLASGSIAILIALTLLLWGLLAARA